MKSFELDYKFEELANKMVESARAILNNDFVVKLTTEEKINFLIAVANLKKDVF